MPAYPVYLSHLRDYRIVMVPAFEMRKIEYFEDRTKKALDNIFKYGQNDVHNVEGKPSVMVGDIIEFEGKMFRVENEGFKELSEFAGEVVSAK